MPEYEVRVDWYESGVLTTIVSHETIPRRDETMSCTLCKVPRFMDLKDLVAHIDKKHAGFSVVSCEKLKAIAEALRENPFLREITPFLVLSTTFVGKNGDDEIVLKGGDPENALYVYASDFETGRNMIADETIASSGIDAEKSVLKKALAIYDGENITCADMAANIYAGFCLLQCGLDPEACLKNTDMQRMNNLMYCINY